jgi:predicted RecA/RadA family phage recombinase
VPDDVGPDVDDRSATRRLLRDETGGAVAVDVRATTAARVDAAGVVGLAEFAGVDEGAGRAGLGVEQAVVLDAEVDARLVGGRGHGLGVGVGRGEGFLAEDVNPGVGGVLRDGPVEVVVDADAHRVERGVVEHVLELPVNGGDVVVVGESRCRVLVDIRDGDHVGAVDVGVRVGVGVAAVACAHDPDLDWHGIAAAASGMNASVPEELAPTAVPERETVSPYSKRASCSPASALSRAVATIRWASRQNSGSLGPSGASPSSRQWTR